MKSFSKHICLSICSLIYSLEKEQHINSRMFTVDNSLKEKVMERLPPGPIYNLVDRFWDQMVIYMLLSPAVYFHYHHLLACTYVGSYGFCLKSFTMLYLISVLLFWEGLRIFAFALFSSMAEYGPVEGLTRVASMVATKASVLYEANSDKIAPVVNRITESVGNLVKKIKNQMPNAAAGGGAGGGQATGAAGNVSSTPSANFAAPGGQLKSKGHASPMKIE